MRKDVYILNELGIKRNKPFRVTFCAYREWALIAIKKIAVESNIEVVDIIKNDDEYKERVLSYQDGYVDCIVLIGWSWIIKDDTLNRFVCVGMHPSDLPLYRGGSPIQHQIIEGLERTKISLMSISSDGVDVGDIWLKEEWNLNGRTMKEILENLTVSTVRLCIKFFSDFETLKPIKQDLSKGSYYRRRKPEDSRITFSELAAMELKDIYNLIRALEDPYPNLYIEDDKGNCLLFKDVMYVENGDRYE